jgi:hypothetical protein
LLPSAIEYGMSIKDFWEEDPELFWAYRFSYINKIERENEINNYNAWLQGMYFFEGVTIALANSFGKANYKYPSEPYGFEKQEDNVPKMTEQEKVVIELKGRVAQVQALWKQKDKGKESSTTEKREEVVKTNGKD